jgi:cytochrome c biogenesis protein CcmG/thiol:disulfide interchange protein DsbE
MKIFASLIAVTLLLTSCSSSQNKVTYTDGKVVNCDSIKHVDGSEIELLCLGDGSVIDLKSLHGPMMLNIWGSWCEPCKAEIPYLRQFYDRYNDQVQLVGLDVEEPSKNTARTFIESHGFIWPSLFDPDGRTRSVIGMGVPVTWFIDESGKVIYKKIGAFADYAEVEKLAKKYFNLQ